MKLYLAILFFAMLPACDNRSKKQETSEKKDATVVPSNTIATPVDSAAMMQAAYTYMIPGPFHRSISGYAGKWKAEMRYQESPEAKMKTTEATIEYKMILGGRYQEGRYSGMMMDMPFEAVSLLGYDNAKKMFVSSYADNLGTCILFMQGHWDEATQTIQFKGKITDPITGADINVRENLRFVDHNTQHMETFMDIGGKEFKNMEISFTRI